MHQGHEIVKCECGNDKFWWFGPFTRCPECYNEYKKDGIEYWLRRFNKEENTYSEHWEHSHSGPVEESFTSRLEKAVKNGDIPRETFQQISDKGLESLSKDKSIIENAVSIQNLVKFHGEHKDDLGYKEAEKMLREKELKLCENFSLKELSLSKDDSIIENAAEGDSVSREFFKVIGAGYLTEEQLDCGERVLDDFILSEEFKKFWRDRAKFELFIKFFIPIKFGYKLP